MTERQLKYRAGLFLIFTHLIILGEIIAMRFKNGFNSEEFSTVFGIVIPMFSGYTAAILAFIIKDRNTFTDGTQKVSGAFSALFFIFPFLFAALVFIAIWLQAHSKSFNNFEDFKTFVMTMESAFAVIVGMFVYSLFQKQPDPGKPDKTE